MVTSEGVALTNADGYHANGWNGFGVKVAVIDAGFGNLDQAIANGELPSAVHLDDFTGTAIGGTTHGTMVAEVVYDMAPGSELYLMKIGDDLDLAEAVDSCIARGVRVINHSMCWPNAGPLDGTGPICAIVDTASAHGIVWVNAAGNHARRHYRAHFSDSDGNGWHDFAVGASIDEFNNLGSVSVGASVGVYLSWNDWWYSDQDYDLFLYYYDAGSGSWVVYDSSTTRQTGSQWPVESISVLMDRSAQLAVRIRKTAADGSQELTLFTNYYDLEYRHEASSVLIPGDAARALTVGAVLASQWHTGPQVYYSSQGPTYDGRVKPDLMGPTSVSVFTGGGLFGGTSAAAPHVAGSAVLLLDRFPEWSPSQVFARLEESVSHDYGDPGKDNVFGSGTVHNDDLVAVELTNLQVAQVGSCARLTWETHSETENLGFEVYRAQDALEARVKLTSELIPGAGTTTETNLYVFEDDRVEAGQAYWYWLADVDCRGRRTLHGPATITIKALPREYALAQNSPNPFNPVTHISFTLPVDGHVELRVYNMLGQLLRTLVDGQVPAGVHSVTWDGKDEAGTSLPGGIYLCVLRANGFRATRKMVLTR
ncbi:MAG: S8 family serine peptidase [candidate division KSB1 bacterium]|jgi:subtilisin family serine protease|nr:S8 family serine peptidase [candidate division KSB1 bacterium]